MNSSETILLTGNGTRYRRSPDRAVTFWIVSAAIFLLLFVIGMLVFHLLEGTIAPQNCAMLRTFLANRLDFSSLKETFLSLLSRDRGLIVLFALGFLATFSYLSAPVTVALLGYRALLLGVSLGASDCMFRTGELSVSLFTLFIIKEAVITALLIGYLTLSLSLSYRLRNYGRRQLGISVLLSLLHLFRLFLFIATAVLLSTVIALITV